MKGGIELERMALNCKGRYLITKGGIRLQREALNWKGWH